MSASRNPGTYEGQLAGRVSELLPGLGTDERLELLGVMDEDDLRLSLAWLAAAHPQIFDFALVRDEALVGRLQERIDRQYDDDPQPWCTACGVLTELTPRL